MRFEVRANWKGKVIIMRGFVRAGEVSKARRVVSFFESFHQRWRSGGWWARIDGAI